MAVFKRCLGAGGFNVADYSSHSFKVGAVTGASCGGLSDELLERLGRWESHRFKVQSDCCGGGGGVFLPLCYSSGSVFFICFFFWDVCHGKYVWCLVLYLSVFWVLLSFRPGLFKVDPRPFICTLK